MRILTTVLCILPGSFAVAQDILVKKNGEEIKAKVVEVTSTEVKYKLFDQPQGAVYCLWKSELSALIYQNGSKEELARPYVNPFEEPKTSDRRRKETARKEQ